METIETVCDTCAKVTFVNFLCNCLACLRDFFPGLTGRSILGVLMFALAVNKISLKLNIPTKLTLHKVFLRTSLSKPFQFKA